MREYPNPEEIVVSVIVLPTNSPREQIGASPYAEIWCSDP